MEILFVCTGNASRSVMGEYFFRDYLKMQGDTHIVCSSAGTEAVEELEPSEMTAEVCLEEGIDISCHRRRLLTEELVHRADVIVVMEQEHAEAVYRLGGEREKVYLLAGGIADPYRQPKSVFYDTKEQIKGDFSELYQFVLARQKVTKKGCAFPKQGV